MAGRKLSAMRTIPAAASPPAIEPTGDLPAWFSLGDVNGIAAVLALSRLFA